MKFVKNPSLNIANNSKMNKTKVELTETGIFVQVLNPMTGRMEWKSQPEDYDYQQELARAAFAGKS